MRWLRVLFCLWNRKLYSPGMSISVVKDRGTGRDARHTLELERRGGREKEKIHSNPLDLILCFLLPPERQRALTHMGDRAISR